MSLEQTVQQMHQKQAAAAATVKDSLVPIRLELKAIWNAYQDDRPGLEQTFKAARAKQELAHGVGLDHPLLSKILYEVYGAPRFPGLMQDIEKAYHEAIQRLDGLHDGQQFLAWAADLLRREPKKLRSWVSQLKKLATEVTEITKEGGSLERMVKAAAARR